MTTRMNLRQVKRRLNYPDWQDLALDDHTLQLAIALFEARAPRRVDHPSANGPQRKRVRQERRPREGCMKKIMVCFDGSVVAKEALKLAQAHAKAFDAKVYLLTSMIGGPEVPRREFDNAERDLKEYAETYFRQKGIACETRLLIRGLTPGEDLVQFAEENGIEEIILGVRRRSKVGKLLFGSTAQYVILSAACPVVTVK